MGGVRKKRGGRVEEERLMNKLTLQLTFHGSLKGKSLP